MLVIDRLAGPGASRERRRSITAQVDTYLQAALRSAFVLLQGSLAQAEESKKGHPVSGREPVVRHRIAINGGRT
ncbi:MAG TPA: hypothetical protein VHN14_30860 [Kofleriaceae bacterium]|jgi:hypothetical protein|nr:hypothetical protein [Kofleriaceae bacterium]